MAIEVEDVRGVRHRLDHPPRRVVSLVPSITETLFELGAGDSVAGVTEWCIFPAWLQEKDRSGRALPKLVRGTKNPDVAAIRALRPDLVHMNLEENLKTHADAIQAFAPVFVTEPRSPADVVTLIQTLGAIHGCEEVAAEKSREIDDELHQQEEPRFTFACPIWKEPWMWCGGDTYVSALVESVGGANVLGESLRYPSRPVDEVVALAPDILFLPDEPYAFTDGDAEELLPAFGGRIIGPFPGHLFTWHGTRTLLGLRALRSWLQC